MKKQLPMILKIVGSAVGANIFFAIALVLAKENIVDDITLTCVLVMLGVVFSAVYFWLKKDEARPLIYTLVCAVTLTVVYICVIRFMTPYYTGWSAFELAGYAVLFCGGSTGILIVDIVCTVYHMIISKRIPANFTERQENNVLYTNIRRFAPMTVGAVCILCIHVLSASSGGVEGIFNVAFVPAVFSSVYFISKRSCDRPWQCFCVAFASHLLFGMPTLWSLSERFYMHYTQNVQLDFYDMKIMIYLSVVCLLLIDLVQTVCATLKKGGQAAA